MSRLVNVTFLVVCPARAGMILTAISFVFWLPGLPRTRGDDPFDWMQEVGLSEFAPHARG